MSTPRAAMTSIRRITQPEPGLVPALAALLQDAVHDGASIGFLAPLARTTAEDYWHGVMQALGEPLRVWVAEEDGVLAGSVQLAPCLKENGRHRAELQKLIVHTSRRGRGIARALVAAAEAAAIESGISLLVLDTLRDSAAETVYARLGWTRAGEIPSYAARPDGVLHPTVYYYKLIAPAAKLARK